MDTGFEASLLTFRDRIGDLVRDAADISSAQQERRTDLQNLVVRLEEDENKVQKLVDSIIQLNLDFGELCGSRGIQQTVEDQKQDGELEVQVNMECKMVKERKEEASEVNLKLDEESNEEASEVNLKLDEESKEEPSEVKKRSEKKNEKKKTPVSASQEALQTDTALPPLLNIAEDTTLPSLPNIAEDTTHPPLPNIAEAIQEVEVLTEKKVDEEVAKHLRLFHEYRNLKMNLTDLEDHADKEAVMKEIDFEQQVLGRLIKTYKEDLKNRRLLVQFWNMLKEAIQLSESRISRVKEEIETAKMQKGENTNPT